MRKTAFLFVTILTILFFISCDEEKKESNDDNNSNDSEQTDIENTDDDIIDGTKNDDPVDDTDDSQQKEDCSQGCMIDDICYPDGVMNPKNICQKCDRSKSDKDWSDNDGQACDDGLFCTSDDVCGSGTCEGTEITVDDGIACNGVESCNEETDSFETTGNQCGTNELCDVKTDSCTTVCTSCAIDGICYGDGQINPANLCQKCDVSSSKTQWQTGNGTPGSKECECEEGFGGDICEQAKCVIFVSADGDDNDEGTEWASPKQTIQAGIDEANLNGCDVWVKAGDYIGNIVMKHRVNVYGSFAGTEVSLTERTFETNDVHGKEMPVVTTVIKSFDPFKIDMPDSPLVNIESSTGYKDHIILDGFGLTLGGQEDNGGAIFISGGSPTIRNVVFSENFSGKGGAVYIENSSPLLTSCHFIENESETDGGNLYIKNSTPVIDDCIIERGFAGDSYGDGPYGQAVDTGYNGGGIYLDSSDAVIKNSIITGNYAGEGKDGSYVSGSDGEDGDTGGNGGGIYIKDSSPQIVNCIISNNSSGNGGNGGRGADYYNLINPVPDNGGNGGDGGIGGAVYAENSTPEFVNCLFTKNSSGTGGNGGDAGSGQSATPPVNDGLGGNGGNGGTAGTIFSNGSTVNFTNCTFADNTNGSGGNGGTGHSTGSTGSEGTFSWMINYSSSAVTVSNSIVMEPDYATDGSTLTVSYSNIDGGCSNLSSPICGDGNIDADPMFNDAGDYTLKSASTCIDAGSDALLPKDTADVDNNGDTDETIPFDIAGNARINTTVDMGAYEY